MNLDRIKNKIIISGSAGSGKTYLIKNHFDIEDDAEKDKKENIYIFSISKSSSKETYNAGRTISSFLYKYFKSLNTTRSLYEQFLNDIRNGANEINFILDKYNFNEDYVFKYKNKEILYIDLRNYIFLEEDLLPDNISDLEYDIIMRRTFSKEDYIQITDIRSGLQEILWRYLDLFSQFIDENQEEFKLTDKEDKEVKVIFDEFSMIPTDKINAILTLLQRRCHITHLLFVGDIAQLPPVTGNNIMNDDYWITELDNFKKYKLMKLWRFKETDMINDIAKLPYADYETKINICNTINKIMYNRLQDKDKNDVDFAIAYTNADCLKMEELESNAFRRSKYKLVPIGFEEWDDFPLMDDEIDSLIDYFNNKINQTNVIYNVNSAKLRSLMTLHENFNVKKNAHKLFQAFYNNGVKCWHSATVHKLQGVTIEKGIKTTISLKGNYDNAGLAYTAITRNADFDDVIMVSKLTPTMFYIPSRYKFKDFIELFDNYFEIISGDFI